MIYSSILYPFQKYIVWQGVNLDVFVDIGVFRSVGLAIFGQKTVVVIILDGGVGAYFSKSTPFLGRIAGFFLQLAFC